MKRKGKERKEPATGDGRRETGDWAVCRRTDGWMDGLALPCLVCQNVADVVVVGCACVQRGGKTGEGGGGGGGGEQTRWTDRYSEMTEGTCSQSSVSQSVGTTTRCRYICHDPHPRPTTHDPRPTQREIDPAVWFWRRASAGAEIAEIARAVGLDLHAGLCCRWVGHVLWSGS